MTSAAQNVSNAAKLPFPLPPTFPPGVDPETYRIEEVTRLLKSAAYYPIFNMPNPAMPNKPILLLPNVEFLMIAVEVQEQLHRFEVRVSNSSGGLKGAKAVGEPVATVHIRWTPAPGDFQAAPNRLPPVTILNPFVSQRFCTLDGQLNFIQPGKTGVRAFGAGRTFPATENGSSVLRIGAAIQILDGLGDFQGLAGGMVINGYIQPPHNLALNLLIRLMDPDGKLKSHSAIPPMPPQPDPDPNAVFMYFLGEPDPNAPVQLNVSPQGAILGSQVTELLRLVQIGFDPATARSSTVEGPVVGSVKATLLFNPPAGIPGSQIQAFFDPGNPRDVTPIQTTGGVFSFSNKDGRPLGTVAANMVEGRAFRTMLQGAPMPVFRFVGFGPIEGGSGYFAGADGMMTMNSAISMFPRTLSNLYMLRFYDPSGRFRETAAKAWSGEGIQF